ncbi:MAG TPA: ubiquinone/menaquinone biosynthesis methyltransferase [Gemmatimonadaceae bacterium]|nr:ubiquinone/menaquinone biosynthesis methyltransferase [Gemmatimonadaceae bacterium]
MPALEAVDAMQDDEAARAAAAGDAGKRAYVRDMFGAIAPRYDMLNRVLSWRLDRRWRRRAIAALEIARSPRGRYLDLCAGTLDIAASIARTPGFSGSVIGADFAEPMLSAGRDKVRGTATMPVAADALALPFADGTCAGAIVGFGIRNVVSLDAALAEVHRVLEPRGRFVILEFSTPRNPLFRAMYNAYTHTVLPRVGAMVSGHGSAYSYLPYSIDQFPGPDALATRMRDAGYTNVRWEPLMFGAVAIHVGDK